MNIMTLTESFKIIRAKTEAICAPLSIEDYVPQPAEHVSPPKWHLAHTTWFFETFILKLCEKNYKEYDPLFAYLFNSYYEHEGERTLRSQRGFLSRPTVAEIMEYRSYVNEQMLEFLESAQLTPGVTGTVTTSSADGSLTVRLHDMDVNITSFASNRILVRA
mgnify:CR=1 FL=1